MRISISNTDFYLLLSVFACLIQPPLPHTDVRIANRNLGFNTFVSLPPDVFNDLVNLLPADLFQGMVNLNTL